MFDTVSLCDDSKIKDEILQILQTLFNHVRDYGEAVVTYFDSCSDLDDGPFGVINFSIDQYINQIESFRENHKNISFEECLEPSKLVSFF
uniref:Uncharacterized protein n=1 Tax=Panagrolaimus sp. ES5 TaxID=591445 RepID=A0AC34GJN9_9BILA